jgi:hypothetical protein
MDEMKEILCSLANQAFKFDSLVGLLLQLTHDGSWESYISYTKGRNSTALFYNISKSPS